MINHYGDEVLKVYDIDLAKKKDMDGIFIERKLMNQSKWLSVIGGIILFIGLLCALGSNHYEAKVMGDAALGIPIIGPGEDSPDWKEKIQTRQLADRFFYFGIFLTAIGIVLQTVGSIDRKINLKAFKKRLNRLLGIETS